jgi:hypothetical protein
LERLRLSQRIKTMRRIWRKSVPQSSRSVTPVPHFVSLSLCGVKCFGIFRERIGSSQCLGEEGLVNVGRSGTWALRQFTWLDRNRFLSSKRTQLDATVSASAGGRARRRRGGRAAAGSGGGDVGGLHRRRVGACRPMAEFAALLESKAALVSGGIDGLHGFTGVDRAAFRQSSPCGISEIPFSRRHANSWRDQPISFKERGVKACLISSSARIEKRKHPSSSLRSHSHGLSRYHRESDARFVI